MKNILVLVFVLSLCAVGYVSSQPYSGPFPTIGPLNGTKIYRATTVPTNVVAAVGTYSATNGNDFVQLSSGVDFSNLTVGDQLFLNAPNSGKQYTCYTFTNNGSGGYTIGIGATAGLGPLVISGNYTAAPLYINYKALNFQDNEPFSMGGVGPDGGLVVESELNGGNSGAYILGSLNNQAVCEWMNVKASSYDTNALYLTFNNHIGIGSGVIQISYSIPYESFVLMSDATYFSKASFRAVTNTQGGTLPFLTSPEFTKAPTYDVTNTAPGNSSTVNVWLVITNNGVSLRVPAYK